MMRYETRIGIHMFAEAFAFFIFGPYLLHLAWRINNSSYVDTWDVWALVLMAIATFIVDGGLLYLFLMENKKNKNTYSNKFY